MTVRGRVWTFGDGIDTDIIIPARHLVLPLEEMIRYAMEPIRPDFAASVSPGDVIIAGKNFGCGSSREQAPAVLKSLGIGAIVAESFARIFFRNAINLGIPVIECDGTREVTREGDVVEIEPSSGRIKIERTGVELQGSQLPEFLMEIIEDGGLIRHLARTKG